MAAADRRWLWGPLSPLGASLAGLTLAGDQAFKGWMLHVYRIEEKGVVSLTPFFDLVMVWNEGISYGLFPQGSRLGQGVLIAIALAASAALWVWLARTRQAIAAAAIGLVIGGALGNAIDRALYGAVADFFSLHAFGFAWYVFNLADAAIVAGVVALLYDACIAGHKKVSNTT